MNKLLIKTILVILGSFLLLFVIGFPFGLMKAIRTAEYQGLPFPIKTLVIYIFGVIAFFVNYRLLKNIDKK